MTNDEVRQILSAALEGRRLLEHPFYRRWEAGELGDGELASYAAQYRAFEESLPDVLETVAAGLSDGAARDLVRANLADELGPPSHRSLFSEFAGAVGASEEPYDIAISDLVALYGTTAIGNPAEALGVIAAYEVQAAEIAETKSTGLRDHYGITEHGRAFWDLHASIEGEHASWTMEALAEQSEPGQLFDAARRSADAWWAFLDEREALAQV